jgi:hypothetical protein
VEVETSSWIYGVEKKVFDTYGSGGAIGLYTEASTAARWSKRGSESPSDMDMTRSWIMSAAAEQSRPFLIIYNDTIVPDFSPGVGDR